MSLSKLFKNDTISSRYWDSTKQDLKNNIDIILEKGSDNKDILLLMRGLLDDIKICTSLQDYVDEVNDGGN